MGHAPKSDLVYDVCEHRFCKHAFTLALCFQRDSTRTKKIAKMNCNGAMSYTKVLVEVIKLQGLRFKEPCLHRSF